MRGTEAVVQGFLFGFCEGVFLGFVERVFECQLSGFGSVCGIDPGVLGFWFLGFIEVDVSVQWRFRSRSQVGWSVMWLW